jgi:glycosyltransferase involved in cell wall biosynthesis
MPSAEGIDKMNNKKVSVLIASYNLAPYLRQAIDSALAQAVDMEVLIEDDASADDSSAILRGIDDPRVSVVFSTENRGTNAVANSLVARASGEYIACLSADDVWEPGKLEKQAAYLDAHPECGMVFGWPRFIDERGAVLARGERLERPQNRPRAAWREALLRSNCLHITTSMYRRALHAELGGYQVDLRLLADLDWYLRVLDVGEIHVMQETLTSVRVRGMSNLSAPTPENLRRHRREIDVIRSKRC